MSVFNRDRCKVCLGQVDSVDHLFVQWEVALLVWYMVLRRVGMNLPFPFSISGVLEVFLGLGLGKKSQICLLSIWHSVVWVIW